MQSSIQPTLTMMSPSASGVWHWKEEISGRAAQCFIAAWRPVCLLCCPRAGFQTAAASIHCPPLSLPHRVEIGICSWHWIAKSMARRLMNSCIGWSIVRGIELIVSMLRYICFLRKYLPHLDTYLDSNDTVFAEAFSLSASSNDRLKHL